jgi:type II secretory pathway component PulF
VGFLGFSIFFTIPQIARLLDGLGTKPGWIISLVFGLSRVLDATWPVVLLLTCGGLCLLFCENPLRRACTELLIRRWAPFRAVFHNLRQTALLYATAILIKAQIPQGHIFRYLIDVARHTPMEKQLQLAMEFHGRDGRFARALEKHVDLDPEIVFTLRVGEETSSLHVQAEKMAQIHERLSLQASEALAVKIAPLMIILTALFAALLFSLTFGSVISVCLKLIRNGA